MKRSEPMKPGEIRDVTGRENQFILILMILRNEMYKRADDMTDRMAATKWGRRDLGLLKRLVDKVQDAITPTLPEKTLNKMLTYSRAGHVEIRMPNAVENPDYHLVEKKDLNTLASFAAYGKCSVCIAEGKEIKQCPLRKVLLQISPPDEFFESRRIMDCEYRKYGFMVVDSDEQD